jgi:hypothetical protein
MNLRLLLALAIIAILATAAYGFAASNSVPDTHAGDGVGAVSGYDVTNVNYVLNDADPATIDAITFHLDAAAAQVKISVDNNTSWIPCVLSSGTDWTCNVSGTTVKSVKHLHVVATS